MPNILANIVFYSWPLVVFWMLSRYRPQRAIFIATTLALLLLPVGFSFDLPLVPPIDRISLTSLSLAVILFLTGKKFKLFPPGLPSKIIIAYLASIVISTLVNPDGILIGSRYLPGLTYYDAISETIRTILGLMPFFLGRAFLNKVEDNEWIFKLLVVYALFYSIPMLGEIRLSPLLHYWVYGFSVVDFFQQMRAGGFRPTVFYGQGLGLAFWMTTCIIAALALRKNKVRIGKIGRAHV